MSTFTMPEEAERDAVEWRERVKIAATCPYSPVHGGCHYPDCAKDCAGRAAAVTAGHGEKR